MTKPVLLTVNDLSKKFELYLQHNTQINVFEALSLELLAGECLVLDGASGIGKSSLLKCIYGNYKPISGEVLVHFDEQSIDLAQCDAQMIHAIRQHTITYVSQFLRVLPRVPAIDVVAAPLIDSGTSYAIATAKAAELLERLHIPERLWNLSPTSFSGGEQQRINIARSFIKFYPIMLLDEPTASLDQKNKNVVIELINEAKNKGVAMLGIFHDEDARHQVADRYLDMAQYVASAA